MRSRILSILGFVIVGFVITTFFLVPSFPPQQKEVYQEALSGSLQSLPHPKQMQGPDYRLPVFPHHFRKGRLSMLLLAQYSRRRTTTS